MVVVVVSMMKNMHTKFVLLLNCRKRVVVEKEDYPGEKLQVTEEKQLPSGQRKKLFFRHS